MSKDDLSDDFVNDLMQETGFNRSQIHKLYIRFQHLDKDKKGYLVREDLINVPQVSETDTESFMLEDNQTEN